MVGISRIAVALAIMALLIVVGCAKESTVVNEVANNLDNQENLTEMRVFYPAENAIVEEPRDVEKAKFGPQEAVRQIFGTPKENKAPAPVLPDTKIIDVTLSKGILTVNFDRSVLGFSVPPQNQQLVVAAVVSTLKQFPEVKKVKFQVEGIEKGAIAGKDVEKFWGAITLKSQPWDVN